MYIISKQWLTVNEYFKWLQKAEGIDQFIPTTKCQATRSVFITQNLEKQALKLQKGFFDRFLKFPLRNIQC